MRYPSSRKNQSGWRLTELLVVVIMLVILVSLILPALMRAKERGRRVNCVNNLKQIVTANLIYANDDKNGRLSPHERASSPPAFHHNWLWHYGGVSPKMYFCPSTSHRYRPNSARVSPFSGEPYFPDLKCTCRRPCKTYWQQLPDVAVLPQHGKLLERQYRLPRQYGCSFENVGHAQQLSALLRCLFLKRQSDGAFRDVVILRYRS